MSGPYDPDTALPRSGRWVRRGLIQVWEGPRQPATDTRFVDEGGDIACPQCGATYDQPCRASNSNKAIEHTQRLVPRLCPCGNIPIARRRRCERCTTPAQRAACDRDTARRRQLREQGNAAAKRVAA